MNAAQLAEKIEEYIDQVNRQLLAIDKKVSIIKEWTDTLRFFKEKFIESEQEK